MPLMKVELTLGDLFRVEAETKEGGDMLEKLILSVPAVSLKLQSVTMIGGKVVLFFKAVRSDIK